MSKRAEKAALKAYPPMNNAPHEIYFLRDGYINGYEQAEKDLALTKEDVEALIEIWMNLSDSPRSLSQIAEETLDIFNKQRP